MKYRAIITNILDKSADRDAFITQLRNAGYCIVSDRHCIYIECDSLDSADLIECLNFNI